MLISAAESNPGTGRTVHYLRFPSKLKTVACLIQDVVSPHCGDKRMVVRCTRHSLPNYFDMTSYHWNVRQNTVT